MNSKEENNLFTRHPKKTILIAENFLSYYRNNSKDSIEVCSKGKYSAEHAGHE